MDTILYIALMLSILTYYVGVLIYSLPIPLRGLKRWAPILITDGLVAASLVYINVGILHLIDKIKSMLGIQVGVTGYISKLVQECTLITISVIRVFSSVISYATKINIYVLFSPLISTLILTLVEALTLSVLVALVVNAGTRLFLVGLLLYSIPFRIGRSAGASIIAFIIVNQILLPLFPYWLLYIYGSTMPLIVVSKLPISYVWGYVRGYYGNLVGSIVWFYPIQGYNESLKFLVREAGVYVSGRPDKGIPDGVYRVFVEYLGLWFDTGANVSIPDQLFLDTTLPNADYRLDIFVPIVSPCPETAIQLSGCSSIIAYRVGENRIKIVCSNTSKTIDVYIAYTDTSFIRVVGMENIYYFNVTKGVRTWRGINVYYENYTVYVPEKSTYGLLVEFLCGDIVYPQVQESMYTREHGFSVINSIMSMFWEYLRFDLIIAMFLTIDALLVYGLARFLGGERIRLLVPV